MNAFNFENYPLNHKLNIIQFVSVVTKFKIEKLMLHVLFNIHVFKEKNNATNTPPKHDISVHNLLHNSNVVMTCDFFFCYKALL